MMSLFHGLTIIPFMMLSIFFLSSCSDARKQKIKTTKVVLKQMPKCSFDPEVFQSFLEKDIQADIDCLGDNFLFATDIIESERPGELSLDEIKQFISDNISDDNQVLLSMDLLFKINSFFTNSQEKWLKKNEVKRLVSFLKKLNKNLVSNEVYQKFNWFSENSLNWDPQVLKFRFYNLHQILNELKSILETFLSYSQDQSNYDLNLLVDQLIEISGIKELDQMKDYFFLKKFLIGGNPSQMTRDEFRGFIDLVPHLGVLALQVYSLIETTGKEEKDWNFFFKQFLPIYNKSVQYIKNLHQKEQRSEVLVSFKELYRLLERDFNLELESFSKIIPKIKSIFIPGDENNILISDVITLMDDYLLKYVKLAAYFFESSRVNKSLFQQKQKINSAQMKELRSVTVATLSFGEAFEAQDKLERILLDYKYFKGTWSSSYLHSDYQRPVFGLLEVAVLEDLVIKAYKHYLSVDLEGEGPLIESFPRQESYLGYHISQKRMEYILNDFSFFLNPQGLIEAGREVVVAETITLLTSLFQFQSDGKADDIEVNETVEFLISVLASAQIASDVQNIMIDDLCKDALFSPSKKSKSTSRPRVDAQCFRDNLVKALEMSSTRFEVKNSSYQLHFPKMIEYMKSLSSQRVSDFIYKTEQFSRACHIFDNGDFVPLSFGDILFTVGGLYNMEQTFNRFDTGKGRLYNNNDLDIPEVSKAYDEVFKGAILGLIPSNAQFLTRKGRAKEVYWYVVRNKGLKSNADLLRFVTFVPRRRQPTTADRDTLASVLSVIAEQSPAAASNPYDCESLK